MLVYHGRKCHYWISFQRNIKFTDINESKIIYQMVVNLDFDCPFMIVSFDGVGINQSLVCSKFFRNVALNMVHFFLLIFLLLTHCVNKVLWTVQVTVEFTKILWTYVLQALIYHFSNNKCLKLQWNWTVVTQTILIFETNDFPGILEDFLNHRYFCSTDDQSKKGCFSGFFHWFFKKYFGLKSLTRGKKY